MTKQSPFDHRRDDELGGLLREALATRDEAGFVARLVAGFDARRPSVPPYVEVLAGWARIGVAAALLVALAVTYLASRGGSSSGANGVDEVLAGTAFRLPPAALLTAQRPPDPNMVYASAFEQ